MSVRGIRYWWLIPAAVALGVLAGILVSLLASTSRTAEAKVLISSPSGPSEVTPFLPNLRELATSGVLAGNVRSTLRLEESVPEVRDDLGAEVRPQSQVIAISATDGDAERARQITQEAAVVFTQLVQSRFGQRSPPLQAAVIDSAQILSVRNRHFLRNALFGAASGLLLGMLVTMLLQPGARPAAGEAVVPGAELQDWRERESQLVQRVKTVTARERELAKRAGQLASRERELEQRAGRLDEQESELSAQADKLGTRADELTKQAEELATEQRKLESRRSLTEPVPDPAPPSEVTTTARPIPTGTWNINDLEHAVQADRDASPEQAEEWRTYLYFLREHASADGTLPRSFDQLIADVFAELLDRGLSS